jgi:hypothetical protein
MLLVGIHAIQIGAVAFLFVDSPELSDFWMDFGVTYETMLLSSLLLLIFLLY